MFRSLLRLFRRPLVVRRLKPGQRGYLPPWVFYRHDGRLYVHGDAAPLPHPKGTFQFLIARTQVGYRTDLEEAQVQPGPHRKADCRVVHYTY